MTKIILGLVGQLAAGKGTVVAYLKANRQAQAFRYSDPLRQTLDLFNLEISRDNMQRLSTVLRQNFSEDILASAMLKRITAADAELIIIDGVRRFTDIENLAKLPEFHLAYIKTDQAKRYQRYIKRNENIGDDAMTFEDFKAKDEAEADRQVPEVGQQAKLIIDNNGSLEQLYQQIENILTQLHGS